MDRFFMICKMFLTTCFVITQWAGIFNIFMNGLRLYCGLSELWNNQSGNNQNWKNQNMSWSESSYLVLWWKVQTSQTQLIVWSLSWSWSRSMSGTQKEVLWPTFVFWSISSGFFFPTFVLFCCYYGFRFCYQFLLPMHLTYLSQVLASVGVGMLFDLAAKFWIVPLRILIGGNSFFFVNVPGDWLVASCNPNLSNIFYHLDSCESSAN